MTCYGDILMTVLCRSARNRVASKWLTETLGYAVPNPVTNSALVETTLARLVHSF